MRAPLLTQDADAVVVDEERDRGAILMLALVFLLATSLVVLSFVSWAGNNLRDSIAFKNSSQTEYAVGGAAQIEIQNLRYSYQAPTTGTVGCTPGGGSSITLNGESVSLWCSIVSNPNSSQTRVITLYGCLSSVAQASCVASPFLQATVSFDDYSLANTYGCTSTSVETTCGTAMSIQAWTIL